MLSQVRDAEGPVEVSVDVGDGFREDRGQLGDGA